MSGLLVGAMLGVFLAGRLADPLVRRPLILIDGIVFIIGTLGSALAAGPAVLVAFRFIMGITVYIASFSISWARCSGWHCRRCSRCECGPARWAPA